MKTEIEKRLLEEVKRFNQINTYTKKLLNEQDATAPAPLPTDAPPPADTDAPMDAPPADTTTPTDVPAPETNDVEEIDITDLVNMTKSIKKDVDDSKTEHTDVIQKMDSLFTKLTDLESKLSEMDSVITKIDELGTKIQEMKPPTPEEKLEMRSLDSYPFNQKPQEFFSQKQDEMRKTGKNEYVLTKQEIDDYSKDMIKNSFFPKEEENELGY